MEEVLFCLLNIHQFLGKGPVPIPVLVPVPPWQESMIMMCVHVSMTSLCVVMM